MNKLMKYALSILFVTLLISPEVAKGQQNLKEKILADGIPRRAFEDKFHWGAAFHLYWSTISGDQVGDSYFMKPSLGGSIRAEYYFNSFLGVGIGAGFQQRGAGIVNQDKTGGAFAHPWITNNMGTIGDPDSTYLERLRFSTLEFPVSILLRTPKDVLQDGMRLSGSIGPTLIHTMQVNQTYQSIIDGFHPYNWVTDNFTRNEIGIQASLGVEIDSGGGRSICQIHAVYSSGLSNVYATDAYSGRSQTIGIRLSWMF